MQTTPDRQKWGGIFYFAAFTLMPLLCSSLMTYYLLGNQDILEGLSWSQWLAFTIVLSLLCALAIIPPTFLAIVMGFFIGIKAFPLLIVINLVAISLIYTFYKFLNFSWIERLMKENLKINKLLTGIRKNELKMIFFTKLSPLFPFAVTNLVFAVSGAGFKNILLGGFGGMIPRTLLAIWVGMEAVELKNAIENPNQDSLSRVIIGALIIISAVGMYSVVKKAIKQ